MEIVLVSDDHEFHRLCAEVLSENARLDWHLIVALPANCPSGADLYIWDDHGRITPPPQLDQAWSKHVFLVHRDDIPEYGTSSEQGSSAAILLKPVTRTCLGAFLRMATSATQERAVVTNTLRAERDEILQYLIRSNLQLQRYDQNRTNFLARAVHDFRAPLTTGGGYCGLLLTEALGPLSQEQKEVLRRMQHSFKRLSRMTSAMFDLSLGKPARQLDLRPGDIRECVEQALHDIDLLANRKGISVLVDVQSVNGILLFDPGQIERVLVNLLENAYKFTGKAGQIEIRGCPFFWERRRMCVPAPVERRIRFSEAANAYRIDVRDTGPRIPQDHLSSIFEEYTSYGGGPDRSGAGLGLAICKLVLNSHKGAIWAEKCETGAMFSFVLPISNACSRAESADDSREQPPHCLTADLNSDR